MVKASERTRWKYSGKGLLWDKSFLMGTREGGFYGETGVCGRGWAEWEGLILRPFLAITFSDLNSQKLNISFTPGAVRPAWDVVICRSYKFQKDTYYKTLGFVSMKSSNFKWVEYFQKRDHIT